jgi:multidrug transporter EmrE-like cation transporter
MSSLPLIAAMAVLFATGNVLLKLSADGDDPVILAVSFIAYLIGNILYFMLLKGSGLGVAAALSSIAQMIVITLVGRFWFGETINVQQTIGIALSICAFVLVTQPTLFERIGK